ncbi:unnamed protein product, partial [Mesorhabditis spiculigera]
MVKPNLPRDEIQREDVISVFEACTPSRPPLINIQDLKLVMRGLGFDPRQEEIQRLLAKLREIQQAAPENDHASKGVVGVDEFMKLLEERFDNNKNVSEMQCAFKLFDRGQKGFIDLADLKAAATSLHEHVTDEELEEMLKEAQGEAGIQGQIDEKTFFEIMKKTCLY